jgi:mannose-6-phosphate isomerase-like protein (cupin superfamily)
MPIPIRRVVTGHDKDGKAVVISDEPASNILERPNRPGVALTNLWQTFENPRYDGPEETVAEALVLHPPKGGTVFRVVQFDPEDPEVLKKLDGASAFAEMGAAKNVVKNARHPFMHRTESVDYAIILTGRIKMLLDDSEVELQAGDVLVQRGTNHAWSNQFDEPCQIAFVLVDAEGEIKG